jgi:antitoxin component of RelBE/YafQ-DinJ toxin-antitoxin module
MVKKKISMTIDEDVFESFKNYCKKNGMKISTKVELLMKETVKNTSLKEFIEQ